MCHTVKNLRLNKSVTILKKNYNMTYVLPRPKKRKYVEIVSTVPAYSTIICKSTKDKILYMTSSSLGYLSLQNNILLFNNASQLIKLIGLSSHTWLLVSSFTNVLTPVPNT